MRAISLDDDHDDEMGVDSYSPIGCSPEPDNSQPSIESEYVRGRRLTQMALVAFNVNDLPRWHVIAAHAVDSERDGCNGHSASCRMRSLFRGRKGMSYIIRADQHPSSLFQWMSTIIDRARAAKVNASSRCFCPLAVMVLAVVLLLLVDGMTVDVFVVPPIELDNSGSMYSPLFFMISAIQS